MFRLASRRVFRRSYHSNAASQNVSYRRILRVPAVKSQKIPPADAHCTCWGRKILKYKTTTKGEIYRCDKDLLLGLKVVCFYLLKRDEDFWRTLQKELEGVEAPPHKSHFLCDRVPPKRQRVPEEQNDEDQPKPKKQCLDMESNFFNMAERADRDDISPRDSMVRVLCGMKNKLKEHAEDVAEDFREKLRVEMINETDEERIAKKEKRLEIEIEDVVHRVAREIQKDLDEAIKVLKDGDDDIVHAAHLMWDEVCKTFSARIQDISVG